MRSSSTLPLAPGGPSAARRAAGRWHRFLQRLASSVKGFAAEVHFWLAARPHLRGLPAPTEEWLAERLEWTSDMRYESYLQMHAGANAATTGDLNELMEFCVKEHQPLLKKWFSGPDVVYEATEEDDLGEPGPAEPSASARPTTAPPAPSQSPWEHERLAYEEFLAWRAAMREYGRQTAHAWPFRPPRKGKGRGRRQQPEAPPPPQPPVEPRPRLRPTAAARAAAAAEEAAREQPGETECVLITTETAVVGKQRCSCCQAIGRNISGCSCRGGRSHVCQKIPPLPTSAADAEEEARPERRPSRAAHASSSWD